MCQDENTSRRRSILHVLNLDISIGMNYIYLILEIIFEEVKFHELIDLTTDSSNSIINELFDE